MTIVNGSLAHPSLSVHLLFPSLLTSSCEPRMTLHCTHLLPQWDGRGAAVGRSSRRRLCWYPPPSSQYLSPSLPPSSFGLKGICSTESTCASERAGSYGLKLDTGRKGASDGRGSFTACCIKSQATRYLPLPRSCCLSPTRAAAAVTGSSFVRWPLGAATESAYLVWKGALPSLRTHSHTSGVPFAPTDRPSV